MRQPSKFRRSSCPTWRELGEDPATGKEIRREQTPCSQGLVWREQGKEVQVGDMKLTWMSAALESVQSLQNKRKFSRPGGCSGAVRVGSVFDGVGLGQWPDYVTMVCGSLCRCLWTGGASLRSFLLSAQGCHESKEASKPLSL